MKGNVLLIVNVHREDTPILSFSSGVDYWFTIGAMKVLWIKVAGGGSFPSSVLYSFLSSIPVNDKCGGLDRLRLKEWI